VNERIDTDVFRLALRRTNGPLSEEQAAELLALIRAGVPTTDVPKARYRPGEEAEQIITDIGAVVAQNHERERQLAENPPAPDARAAMLAEQAERVKQAAARLAEVVRVRPKRKVTDG